MKDEHTYGKKWPEKVVQRSFIKEHSFPNGLYMITYLKLGMGIVANADLVYVCNVKNFIDDLL